MPILDTSLESFLSKEVQPLVFQFFVAFSRAEYSLKRAGFITTCAKPAWNDYARRYRDKFDLDASVILREAGDYFAADPPLKQVVIDGALSWSPQRVPLNNSMLLRLLLNVRCVRNNLFHGGKYPISHHQDPARNATLLNHGMVILDGALRLDECVARHFASPL